MSVEKGLVMINTGPGKGKTTAALGQALRAAGQGLRVLMIQFIKGSSRYGEMEALERFGEIELRRTGLGLIGDDEDLEPHRQKARQGWDMAKREVLSGNWGLVILDEIWVAVKRGFISAEEVAELIKAKPTDLHLLLTGRYCPEEMYPLADTVTVMQAVKHHMDSGVTAQVGIEY